MFKNIAGIKIKNAFFDTEAILNLFKKNDNEVCNFSIVYGRNGSGKSTISRAIESIKYNKQSFETSKFIDLNNNEVVLNEETKKYIHIFNENYIDKIKFSQVGLDTIIIFGDAQRLEEKIALYDRQLSTLTPKYNTIKQKDLDFNNPDSSKSPQYHLNEIAKKLRGENSWSDREANIKGIGRRSNVNLETYKEFIELRPKDSRDDLILKFNEKLKLNNSIKDKKNPITTEIIPPILPDFSPDEVINLLKKNIEKPELTTRDQLILEKMLETKGEQFIKDIETYFKDKNNNLCPFCTQTVSQEHKKIIFASITQLLTKEVKIFLKELSKYRLDEISFDFEPFEDLISDSKSIAFKLINDYNLLVKSINSHIDERMDNPYKPFKVTPEIENNILSFVTKKKELVNCFKKIEENRSAFNEKIANRLRLEDELYQINNEIAYYDIKSLYENYVKQEKEKKENQEYFIRLKKIYSRIESKQNSTQAEKANLRIAIDEINKGLNYIFFSKDRLSISLENGTYRIISRGHSVLPKDISIGERNAIALAYFFTEAMQDLDITQSHSMEHLFILDDPISSLDMGNKIGLMSYLKFNLKKFFLGNSNSKLLILTHDLQVVFDSYKMLEEIKKTVQSTMSCSCNLRTLELNNKSIINFNYKSRQEYSIMLNQIYQYAKNPTEELELYVGNIMRKVLEAFATFNYRQGIEEISTDSDILQQLEYPFNEYFENLMYRLVLNGGSHTQDATRTLNDLNFNDYLDSSEKQKTAKAILVFISLLNITHLRKHLISVNVSLSEFNRNIDTWKNNIKSQYPS